MLCLRVASAGCGVRKSMHLCFHMALLWWFLLYVCVIVCDYCHCKCELVLFLWSRCRERRKLIQTQNHSQRRRSAKYSMSYTGCIDAATCTGAKVRFGQCTQRDLGLRPTPVRQNTLTLRTLSQTRTKNNSQIHVRAHTPTCTDKPPHTRPNRGR